MVMIQLIDNHQYIDIAEWDETQGKDAQCIIAFIDKCRFICTEQPDNRCRTDPHEQTGDCHGNGYEPEGLPENDMKSFVVAFAYLNGTQRLQGLAGARQEQVVDLQ